MCVFSAPSYSITSPNVVGIWNGTPEMVFGQTTVAHSDETNVARRKHVPERISTNHNHGTQRENINRQNITIHKRVTKHSHIDTQTETVGKEDMQRGGRR